MAEAPAPQRPDHTPLPRQSQVFFYLILAGLLVLSWLVFRPFLIFMVTGVFVAVLALPIDRKWEKMFPNRLAALFTMGTLLLIIVVPLVGLGFALANDAVRMAEAVQSGEARDWLDRAIESQPVQGGLDFIYPAQTPEERNATVEQNMERAQDWVVGQLQRFAAALAGIVFHFLIALVVVLFTVYYVLTDGDRLVAFIKRVAPLPAAQVGFLLKEGRNGLHAVFIGQILTSLIQGALGGIGFLIVGLPGAVLWAAVMAILSLLPIVGAFLVWIPASIYLIATGEIFRGVALALYGGLVVSQVDNFIRPKLIGDRADIHPVFVLVGVLGGVTAFGFIGLFLGPLIVGITISVLKVWETHYLDPTVGRGDPTWDPEPYQKPRQRRSLTARIVDRLRKK